MTIYSQIQKNLLFHWTSPRPKNGCKEKNSVAKGSGSKRDSRDVGKSRRKDVKPVGALEQKDRLKYVEQLECILQNGLKFREPQEWHHEWIERGTVELRRPIVSFTEWSASGARHHSALYGHMAFGFTRRFIMGVGGRPLVYVANRKGDLFRKSVLQLIKGYRASGSQSRKATEAAEVVEAFLKLYSVPPAAAGAKKPATAKKEKKRVEPDPDERLLIRFGAPRTALEDREWRVIQPHGSETSAIPCEPGGLAMIILPDHATLHHALASAGVKKLVSGLAPAVCMISKEMLLSI